ncbi:MAG TPA: ATP-binding protein [Pyrinomonadaceae bacterium]|jgi:signal transduction histidine kinase/ActR/RegA family two-component response regulator
MSAAEASMLNRRGIARAYMWSLVIVGSTVVLISFYKFPYERIDVGFGLLSILVIVSSLIAVRIPRVSGRITVADTFIFLTLFLYGGAAAILMSALEGVCSTLLISKRARTILFNSAILATSTFLTATVLRAILGPTTNIIAPGFSASLFLTICLVAVVQYVANSGLIAIEKSYKVGESIWQTWKTYYLWTAITYFAGASAAAIVASLMKTYGFYAVIATFPIVVIIYFTYQIYLKNIEASAVQTEVARQHVEELSKYIAELQNSEEARERLLVRAERARADAEAANRMKDEFLATLSHELRTPLTSLLGWASVLRETERDEALLTQGLEAIERNARVQVQLIDDLLDVSRIVSGKLHLDVKPIDISAVIQSAINVVRPAADAKGITLDYWGQLGLGAISADPARLQQIVWNLLSNAVKFTPRGGSIKVRLEQEGAYAKVNVQDTGIGIEPEFLPSVFDRFRQADSSTTRNFGGLGLGLAIVRHLVELHGGTVWANSAGAGKGATFSAMFPLLPERTQAPTLYNSTETKGIDIHTLEGLRVLLVDDEPEARQIISTVIKRMGAEVKACESATEALQLLVEWRPDVLMSDIAMPDEDGYSLIGKVRSLPRDKGGATPAAALTAYARDEDRKRALDAGYQMHIAKPVTSNQLVMLIARLVGRTA